MRYATKISGNSACSTNVSLINTVKYDDDDYDTVVEMMGLATVVAVITCLWFGGAVSRNNFLFPYYSFLHHYMCRSLLRLTAPQAGRSNGRNRMQPTKIKKKLRL